ncbi:coiled-coil domain-containing protein 81-like [Engraulis encrasicolus]|uniref:coiled-coil domain-containing protein 81-like n=1 Tax=Engraulis encrasicolus TaxID=184585 RepID=UPI002FD16831
MQNGGEVERLTPRFETPQDTKISHLLLFASDVEKHAFPTLFALPQNDIESIWSKVSSFIEQQMVCHKGVHIPGLGTFTFSVQKVDRGKGQQLILSPIFLLAEKFKRVSGMKQRKASPAGEVPVVPLNFSLLSMDGPFERDVVERCVRESLMLLVRVVSQHPSALLGFPGLGLLTFRRGLACMRFHRAFLWALDQTWGLARRIRCSRAGVSSSVEPDRVHSRSCGAKERDLATLTPCTSSMEVGTEQQPSALETKGGGEGEEKAEEEEEDEKGKEEEKEEEEEEERKEAGNDTINQLHRRETLTPAKVNGIFLTEDLYAPLELTNRFEDEGDGDEYNKCLSPPADSSPSGQLDTPPSPLCTKESCQGLCILCKARAVKNVSGDYESEKKKKKRREDEDERLYMRARLQIDKGLELEELAYGEMCREKIRRAAACNLEMARERQEAERREEKFHPSYVFRTRTDTPPQLPKQRQYQHELQDQVHYQGQRQGLDRQTKELVHRTGQIELADEIALERQQQVLRKASDVRCYQKALDTQRRGRCRPFGSTTQLERTLMSMSLGELETPEVLAEQRQRARELHHQQIHAAILKRRHAHHSRILEQKREIHMLSRTREEIREDQVTRHRKLCGMREALDEAWTKSMEARRRREQEEKDFLRAGGCLVLDGCENFKCCRRCTRRLSFSGGTNIWKESRYQAGARLMV